MPVLRIRDPGRIKTESSYKRKYKKQRGTGPSHIMEDDNGVKMQLWMTTRGRYSLRGPTGAIGSPRTRKRTSQDPDPGLTTRIIFPRA